jgi:hypothetical protein
VSWPSREAGEWWFAGWMVVLTTAQVVAVLGTELAAHGSSSRKNASCRLVRFDMRSRPSSPSRIWGSHATEPSPTDWRQFWTDLQACGRAGWPQLIRLPAHLVGARDYERSEVVALLSQAGAWFGRGERSGVELVTLGPRDDRPEGQPDVFRVIVDPLGGTVPRARARSRRSTVRRRRTTVKLSSSKPERAVVGNSAMLFRGMAFTPHGR